MSAYHLYDWNKVIGSYINDWYLDENSYEPVDFDGRVDAVALLHSSSVMYLGKMQYQNEVKAILVLVILG